MILKESERKQQLKEIVARHLGQLMERYGFSETAAKSPVTARDLMLLAYEELKSELFLKYLPVRNGEILALFDEFFKGSHRETYLELVKFDFEMFFLAPTEEEAAPGAGKGRLDEIVLEESAPLKKVYKDLMKQPAQFIIYLEKNFSAVLKKLKSIPLAPDPDELIKLYKGNFPGVDEVYFKVLNKYRQQIADLAKIAAEPVAAPPPAPVKAPPAEPVAAARPPEAPEAAAPSNANLPSPGQLWKDLVNEFKLPPREYYTYIKAKIAEWEKSFGSDKKYFHNTIFSLYKQSQKTREKLESIKAKQIQGEVINAGYLTAALSIAFAKSSESGMRGAGIKVSVR